MTKPLANKQYDVDNRMMTRVTGDVLPVGDAYARLPTYVTFHNYGIPELTGGGTILKVLYVVILMLWGVFVVTLQYVFCCFFL